MVCVVRSMSHRCQRDIVAVNRNLISRFLQVEEATQGLNRFNQASSLSNAPLQSRLGQLYCSLPTLDFIPCSPPMPGGSPCEIWCWGLQRRTVKTILVMKCVFFFFFFCFPCFVLFGGGQGFNHYVLIHRELLHRELKRIIKESFQKVHPILIRIH